MRTTVDIEDDLYLQLKVMAATEGKSVKQLIARGAALVLTTQTKIKGKRKIDFPLIPSRNPGSLKLDNEAIYDLIDFP